MELVNLKDVLSALHEIACLVYQSGLAQLDELPRFVSRYFFLELIA